MEPEAARQRSCPVASVLDNDHLLEVILHSLDSPTWLVRAALVSTRWLRGARASNPDLLTRFRERCPPRIIALHSAPDGHIAVPVPPELATAARLVCQTLASSYYVCDCLDGRLLVGNDDDDDTYDVRRLLHSKPERRLPSPPKSMSVSFSSMPGKPKCYRERILRLLDCEDNSHDDTSCVCFYLAYNSVELCVEFSILRSGVWGAHQCAVRELRQGLRDTDKAQRVLMGSKFYMMTTLGYILGLDLTNASFFTVQLPDEVRNNRTLKFSRAHDSGRYSSEKKNDSGLYLVGAKGFQLYVWRTHGVGQFVLRDTISVREVCGHLNVEKWEPDDGDTAPVEVVLVGDDAEFVIFNIVASEIVCCMQVRNRVVEKVITDEVLLHKRSLFPITMDWPPIFPVLDREIRSSESSYH